MLALGCSSSGGVSAPTTTDGTEPTAMIPGGAAADAGDPAVGEPTFYATFNTAAAPTVFAGASVSSYRTGSTVISGQAVGDPSEQGPVDVLPPVYNLTLRFTSGVGTFRCDAVGTAAVVELTIAENSNADEETKDSSEGTSGSCSVVVSRFDPPGGRIVGTFTATVDGDDGYAELNSGVFDVPSVAVQ